VKRYTVEVKLTLRRSFLLKADDDRSVAAWAVAWYDCAEQDDIIGAIDALTESDVKIVKVEDIKL
jgi:hypothetical protein